MLRGALAEEDRRGWIAHVQHEDPRPHPQIADLALHSQRPAHAAEPAHQLYPACEALLGVRRLRVGVAYPQPGS